MLPDDEGQVDRIFLTNCLDSRYFRKIMRKNSMDGKMFKYAEEYACQQLHIVLPELRQKLSYAGIRGLN
jgi:hypothetical protein